MCIRDSNTGNLDEMNIRSVKDISTVVPNLFIPDYGSKLISSAYIRGIGSRINSPAVGLYVNNVPYLDKSAFDFDFIDIASIEVLKGPQGTLYGRNTMAGLVNIKTLSPLEKQGSKIKLSFGNYNLWGELEQFRIPFGVTDDSNGIQVIYAVSQRIGNRRYRFTGCKKW